MIFDQRSYRWRLGNIKEKKESRGNLVWFNLQVYLLRGVDSKVTFSLACCWILWLLVQLLWHRPILWSKKRRWKWKKKSWNVVGNLDVPSCLSCPTEILATTDGYQTILRLETSFYLFFFFLLSVFFFGLCHSQTPAITSVWYLLVSLVDTDSLRLLCCWSWRRRIVGHISSGYVHALVCNVNVNVFSPPPLDDQTTRTC